MSLGELRDRIKELPISSIISQYITLTKKSASNNLGLCPFHKDSRPSLHVNDQKNMFMCFACQTGGDAITFVEKLKGVNFKEAIAEISKLAGISYESYVIEERQSPRVEMAKKILSKAMILYQKVAEKNSQYLEFIKKRKIDLSVANNFSLGLATQVNLISEYLESIKDSSERQRAIAVAREIHLIRQDNNDAQKNYDTFRHRIIFPIWDNFGHVVGFGGRTLIDHKAKYLNSQESFCFDKKNILYGLHFARPYIREKNQVILVEGYMDLVTMHQNNFKNSVAVMGVAISDQMIAVLKNLTTNFYLALDSDDAGYAAMERINTKCLEHNVVAKYISFAPHKDPDEFLTKEGAIAFNDRVENAVAVIDLIINKMLPEVMPEIADRKLELLQKVFAVVAPLGDKLVACERITLVAKRIGVQSDNAQIIGAYREFLKREIKVDYLKNKKEQSIPASLSAFAKQALNSDLSEEESVTSVQEKEKKITPKQEESWEIGKIEKKLLQEIVQHPECLLLDKISELIEFLDNSDVKRYVTRLRNLVYEIDDSEFSTFAMDLVDNGEYPLPIKESVGYGIASQSSRNKLDRPLAEKIIFDFIQELKMENLNREYGRNKALLKDITLEKDAGPIQEKIKEILKQINAIKKSYTRSAN